MQRFVMSFERQESLSLFRFSLTLAAAIGTVALAFAPPVDAAWMSGRGNDDAGVTYLAVINDAPGGERIELNCTPDGQAFLALTWDAADSDAVEQGALTLRFFVGDTHRFAAPARYRALDAGWAVAELNAPDILGPLTEAMLVSASNFSVEVVQYGAVLNHARFDMDAAAANITRYRSYCRM